MSSAKNAPQISLPEGQMLVLFDGYCNLCNGAVQFIIKRDRKEKFLFASLSWPIGEEIKALFPEKGHLDSILLYKNGRLYSESEAALHIAAELGMLWPLTKVFWVLPQGLRNNVYRWVARNRYRWFGKKDTCMIPDRDLSFKFLKD